LEVIEWSNGNAALAQALLGHKDRATITGIYKKQILPPALQNGKTMVAKISQCASRPDCPCDFCVRVRAEIAAGCSEKDEQNKIAEDFLRL
jgi:hypothetical protein